MSLPNVEEFIYIIDEKQNIFSYMTIKYNEMRGWLSLILICTEEKQHFLRTLSLIGTFL
jgi:hypothetical protein